MNKDMALLNLFLNILKASLEHKKGLVMMPQQLNQAKTILIRFA